MNKTHSDLLKIIGAALNGTTLQLSAPLNWEELFDFLSRLKHIVLDMSHIELIFKSMIKIPT